MDGDDICVLQAGGRFGLSAKPLDIVRGGQMLLADLFEGDAGLLVVIV